MTAAALVLGVAIGVFGFAGAASAGVSVDPKEATQGGYARIAFLVPKESDSASTKVEVVLPEAGGPGEGGEWPSALRRGGPLSPGGSVRGRFHPLAPD